jgi:hypothetical protein
MKRILICGHGRAGKDTAAMFLSKLTGIPYAGSTSWAAKELVAKKLGIHPQEAWENRHLYRSQWKQICDRARRNDQTLLMHRALESVNYDLSAGISVGWKGIVVGVRDIKEINAAKEQKLFDRILWIDNMNVPHDSTVTFCALDCDESICNDGTLEEFRLTLFRWTLDNGLVHNLYLSPTADRFRE